MRAAPKLLGALIMGGGSAQPGDGGGESNSSQISLLSSQKYAKTAKKQVLSNTYRLINRRKRRVLL